MVQVLLAADMVSGIWKQGNVLTGVEFLISMHGRSVGWEWESVLSLAYSLQNMPIVLADSSLFSVMFPDMLADFCQLLAHSGAFVLFFGPGFTWLDGILE